MALRDPRMLDLEVEVGRSVGGQLEVRVLHSPFNRPRAAFRSPFASGRGRAALTELNDWVNAYLEAGGPPSGKPPNVERLGRELFRSLLPEGLGRTFQLTQGTALEPRDTLLRLRLSFDTHGDTINEAAVLPWELLRDPDRGEYLALDSQTSVVRYLDSSEPLRLPDVGEPLRVLLVAANPKNAKQLDLELERQAILRAVADHPRLEVDTLAEPTLDSLDRTMRRKFIHVLHFMGHGGFDDAGGFVLFEDPEGDKRIVTDHVLRTCLDDWGSLAVVILAACKGAQLGRRPGADTLSGVAAGLSRHRLLAVIGMQLSISDRAASCFSGALYGALAERALLEEAVTAARRAMYKDRQDSLEWVAPVLFLSAPEGRLLDRPGRVSADAEEEATGPLHLGIVSIGEDSWGGDILRQVDERLNLTPYFRKRTEAEASRSSEADDNGRYIRDPALWPVVGAEARSFLPSALSRTRPNVLRLATHLSIGYAVGRSVEAMAGFDLALGQGSIDRGHVWRADEGETGRDWQHLEAREAPGRGSETALVVNVSQPVTEDVKAYLSDAALPIGPFLVADLPASQLSIKSGRHGFELAENLFQWVRDQRRQQAEGPLHLFLATPASFAFFLGRLTRDWGEVQLYEYDRSRKMGVTYFPSFRVGGRS